MENLIAFTLFGSTMIFVLFFVLLFFILYAIDRAEESIGYAVLVLTIAGAANLRMNGNRYVTTKIQFE